MSKEKKKSIILTIILIVIAIILLVAFVVSSLRSSGKIGSSDSGKVISEFEKKFNSKERIVIYYASPSCSFCKLQTPILETIASDYNMKYYYLDSSKLSNSQRNKALKTLELKEHATPSTVVVENGKVIDSVVGYVSGTEYVEFLKNAGMLPEDAVYSKEKNITFINFDEYKNLISNDDTHVVVIGQTTCSHCIAIKPALNSVAGDYNITINYLNLTDMTSAESSEFHSTLKDLEYNDPKFLEEGSFGTPLILVIRNKKITNYISGERTTSQLVREFKNMGLIQ